MTESVSLNKARTQVVPDDSPDAAWKIHRKDAERLGLIKPVKDAPTPEPTEVKAPRRATSRAPKRKE